MRTWQPAPPVRRRWLPALRRGVRLRFMLPYRLRRAAPICTLMICLASGAHGVAEPLNECAARNGLPNVFSKLNAGEQVRVAYLGGSITAQEGWRPKTLQWFREQFPSAKI